MTGRIAGSTRKLARLTGLLLEEGRPGEAEPLLRRMLAATEEENVRLLRKCLVPGSGSLEYSVSSWALLPKRDMGNDMIVW